MIDPFDLAPVAKQIWSEKYRFSGTRRGDDGQDLEDRPADHDLNATWRRVALAAASAEADDSARVKWADAFEAVMADLAFLPGGRILAGAGTGRRVTLFNCFVLGAIPDDLGGIFEANREAALTMQQGGGIGHDFSTDRKSTL